MMKVCSELGLSFGRWKENGHKDGGMTEPIQQQIYKKLNKLEEEHLAIMSMYKADRQKYGKFLQPMENNLLK